MQIVYGPFSAWDEALFWEQAEASAWLVSFAQELEGEARTPEPCTLNPEP